MVQISGFLYELGIGEKSAKRPAAQRVLKPTVMHRAVIPKAINMA